ncbi:MAG: FAD-dependent monooxygenase [Jiangellaceae bacterium]
MTGRVLVVGGGIAGFAAARALERRGIGSVVVDRLAAPPAGGLGLNLPGNAVQALRSLGVGDELAERGVPIRRREYRNAKGRLLFAVDESAFWGTSVSSVCVRRSDLLDLLRAGVPADTVRWGTTVTGLTAGPDDVRVHLGDGRTEAYTLVVGADGVRSAVRRVILGDADPRPALLSAESWRFVVPNPGVACWTVWSGAEGTFLLIPVDADHVYGYASATRGGTIGADVEWLSSTFARFPDLVQATVTALMATPSSLYPSPVEEVRVERWSTQRGVLIGDAAHATGPVWAQGAALAVEDALVLADLLADRDDWTHVGEDFERRRRPRVSHVQKMTDRLSRVARLPTWLRDPIAPIVGPRTYRETYGPLRQPVA